MSSRLRRALAEPESKRRYVRSLFATIADRYDLITRVLSYGQDRRWKERVIDLCGARPGIRALDLACGTGDIAFAIERRGARVVGLDLTVRMLQLARMKHDAVPFVAGDMLALPFPDRSFDVVTTGYGLRNVPDLAAAIAEAHRVLKPGGIFVSLDFDRPSNAFVRTIYLSYLTVVGSTLGLLLHRDPDTYRYIPESIRRYPGAAEVRTMIARAGFSRSEHLPVLGGFMAIHHAQR